MFGYLRLKANAKINFCLDIIGVREDGYHLIESVMQSISLCDKVSLSKTRLNTIELNCPKINIPKEKNIAYKAAKAFLEEAGIDSGVRIKIKKNIPEQAGMGGASADAAAVIVGLNRLFKVGFSEQKLCEIGAKIGADVPFCIMGGTMLVRGIGEVLTELDNCADCHIVIVKGTQGVSTKEAYDAIDSAENLPSVNIQKPKGRTDKPVGCVQHGIPMRILDIIAAKLAQDFRRKNKEGNDNLHSRRQIDTQFSLKDIRHNQKAQCQNTIKHTLKISAEAGANQNQQNSNAQYDINDKGNAAAFLWTQKLLGLSFLTGFFQIPILLFVSDTILSFHEISIP